MTACVFAKPFEAKKFLAALGPCALAYACTLAANSACVIEPGAGAGAGAGAGCAGGGGAA